MKLIFFLIPVLLTFCGENSANLTLHNTVFLYKNPGKQEVKETAFPVYLLPGDPEITHFLYHERTGLWSPEQYALRMIIKEMHAEEVEEFYKKTLLMRGWQILQTKKIKGNTHGILFMNARDFLDRSLSIVIEDTSPVTVKLYIKKATDD